MELTSEFPNQRMLFADDLDALFDENYAAAYLDVAVKTIRNWRTLGYGPEFVRQSARCIKYRKRDLIAWIELNKRSSTSYV